MGKPLAQIKHHSGMTLTVESPAPAVEFGMATVAVTLDSELRVALQLNEAELRKLRDGVDKALAQLAKHRPKEDL